MRLNRFAAIGTSFSGQILFTFGSTIFIFGLGMITSLLTARLLGPVGRGELAAVQLWGPFFGGLAVAGVPEAVVYFVGKNSGESRNYIITGIALSIITGVPVSLVAYLLMPSLLFAYPVEVITLARLYVVVLAILFAVNMVSTSILRGLKLFGTWNLIRPLGTFGWLLAIIAVYLVAPVNSETLSVGFLLANACASLFALVIALRRTGGPYSIRTDLWPQLLRFGLPTVLSLLPTYLIYYGRLSQMVVAAMLSPEALGFTVVAINWSSIVSLVPQSIGPIIFPRISALSQGQLLDKEISRATRLTVLMSSIASLTFIIVSPAVIPLVYGTVFEPAVVPAVIMLITAIPAALRKVTGDALRGLNRPQTALIGEAVSLGSTLLLLLLFITPMGITGAALALLISEVVSAGVTIVILSRKTQIGLARLLIPTIQDFRTALAFSKRLLHLAG